MILTWLLLTLGGMSQAIAKQSNGFVTTSLGHSIYYEKFDAKPSQPTVVLLNGLTYSTKNWDALTAELTAKGVGVLRIDFYGQGETLFHAGPVTEKIPVLEQAQDLDEVTRAVGLKGRLNLIGLSYGGGVAIEYARLFPQRLGELMLVAPYLKPVQVQDGWVRTNVQISQAVKEWIDTMSPISRAFKITEDQWYDYFLRILVSSLYPFAEPIILEHPWKLEATFRMAQGIRHLNAVDVARRLAGVRVHLVEAGSDQYLPAKDLEEFWKALPVSARYSYFKVLWSEHKIPEAAPGILADWIDHVVQGRVSKGKRTSGNALTREIGGFRGQKSALRCFDLY